MGWSEALAVSWALVMLWLPQGTYRSCIRASLSGQAAAHLTSPAYCMGGYIFVLLDDIDRVGIPDVILFTLGPLQAAGRSGPRNRALVGAANALLGYLLALALVDVALPSASRTRIVLRAGQIAIRLVSAALCTIFYRRLSGLRPR